MKLQSSVHLEKFPTNHVVSQAEMDLMTQMDFVRKICSAGLSIRKRYNLRARLPLNCLTVITKEHGFLINFIDLIKDEVNVKNIQITNDANDIETKILIDAKICAKRLGGKFQNTLNAVKAGNWQKHDNGIIANDEIIYNSEYTLILKPKGDAENFESFENIIVTLDTTISEYLEVEGCARDIIRMIQDERKSQNLNIQDRISISYYTEMHFHKEAMNQYCNLIKDQTLAKDIILTAHTPDMKGDTKFLFLIKKL